MNFLQPLFPLKLCIMNTFMCKYMCIYNRFLKIGITNYLANLLLMNI